MTFQEDKQNKIEANQIRTLKEDKKNNQKENKWKPEAVWGGEKGFKKAKYNL